ncbi:MFS transporter, partial [Xanthomonas citri pv. citri]|nr:MFS transporter [Xanthomonas citri pv. citri]
MIGWLSLAHQIGSALGAYVPGVIYTVTGEYTLAFYLSIGMLVLASVMNVMLREPAAVTRDSAAVVDK